MLICNALLAQNQIRIVSQGDSGGPLVTKVDGRWTVIGLTSWGYSCAKEDSPGIFSKVSSFVYMLKQDIGLSLHHTKADADYSLF